MTDVFTRAKRSDVMSRIRSRGNKDTELVLAGLFRAEGITGWRRQVSIKFRVSSSEFRVRPDFVFPQRRLAVFVDGCFWHGCPKHATKPKGNATFWHRKLAANQARDRRANRELKRVGRRGLRLWKHELALKNRSRLIRRLRQVLP